MQPSSRSAGAKKSRCEAASAADMPSFCPDPGSIINSPQFEPLTASSSLRAERRVFSLPTDWTSDSFSAPEWKAEGEEISSCLLSASRRIDSCPSASVSICGVFLWLGRAWRRGSATLEPRSLKCHGDHTALSPTPGWTAAPPCAEGSRLFSSTRNQRWLSGGTGSGPLGELW